MTLFDFVLSSDLTGVSFSLLSGIVIELLLIPHILLISKRKRLYDIPDSRKSHLECIPRLAGVSFLPAFLLSFLPVVSLYGGSVRELSFLICGASLIFIMGMKDDLIGMRWSYKFVVQLIAALCMIASGTFVNNLYGLFGIYELSPLIGYPLTVFLVVYILNTVNLIDGVDGLASGIVSVAALVLGICLYREHSCHYAALAFAVLGTQIDPPPPESAPRTHDPESDWASWANPRRTRYARPTNRASWPLGRVLLRKGRGTARGHRASRLRLVFLVRMLSWWGGPFFLCGDWDGGIRGASEANTGIRWSSGPTPEFAGRPKESIRLCLVPPNPTVRIRRPS